MGIFDLFTAGKQAEEITRAFIGAYAVSRMNDDQRQVIMFHVYRMLCESGPFRLTFDEANKKFNTSPAIVQAGLMVNAMINLKVITVSRDFDGITFPIHLLYRYTPKKPIGQQFQT